MKGKEISKVRTFYECIIEKFMEWLHFLRYGLVKHNEWISNLTEEYCIHKNHIDKEYVRDFLSAREKILNNNHYRMSIKELPECPDENIIGRVVLMRKKKYIHHATLKIKNCNNSKERLIFWSFEEGNNNMDKTK